MDWNMAPSPSLSLLSNCVYSIRFHSIVNEIIPVLRCNKVCKKQTTLKRSALDFLWTFKPDRSYIHNFAICTNRSHNFNLDFYGGNTLSFRFNLFLCDSISFHSICNLVHTLLNQSAQNFITLLVRCDLDTWYIRFKFTTWEFYDFI